MAKRALTEQQKLFLEVLFEAADGDVVTAKKMAGYAPTYPTSSVVNTLKDEMIEAAKTYLAQNAPKAAIGLVSVLTSPGQLGVKEKLMAAKDILDRTGLAKTEKLEVSTSGLFILPAKEINSDDA